MSDAPARASAGVRRVLTGLLALMWLGAFVATHLPPGKAGGMGISDKLLHYIGYAVLATPMIFLLKARGNARRRRIALTLGILLAYGVIDEVTQPLAGRAADVLDWLCDAAGVATSVALWETIFALRGRSRPSADGR